MARAAGGGAWDVAKADAELSALWEKHACELRRRCVRWMASTDAGEEAFGRFAVRAVEQYRRFAGEIRDPHAWLVCLARRVCIDMHRAARRQPEWRTGCELELTAAGSGSPEQNLLRRELHQRLTRSINALPPHLREPLVLRARDGAPYDAIARALRLSEENARKRMAVARQAVRRLLRASPGLRRPRGRRGSRAIAVTLTVGDRAREIVLDVPDSGIARTTAWLRSYVAAHPKGSKMRLELARRLLAAGDLEEAIAEYRRLLAHHPRSAEAAAELATILRALANE